LNEVADDGVPLAWSLSRWIDILMEQGHDSQVVNVRIWHNSAHAFAAEEDGFRLQSRISKAAAGLLATAASASWCWAGSGRHWRSQSR
jgi:hypothetical protein